MLIYIEVIRIYVLLMMVHFLTFYCNMMYFSRIHFNSLGSNQDIHCAKFGHRNAIN